MVHSPPLVDVALLLPPAATCAAAATCCNLRRCCRCPAAVAARCPAAALLLRGRYGTRNSDGSKVPCKDVERAITSGLQDSVGRIPHKV